MITAARWCLFLAVAMIIGTMVLAVFATPAEACPRCGLFGSKCAFRHVAVQQVVAQPIVYPQVNYFVGAPIRVEAIVQQALKQDPEYAEFQKFRIWRQQQGTQPLAETPAARAETPQFAALTKFCASCHAGDSPKKGLLLDGTAKISCNQYVAISRRVNAGTMPPKDHPPLSGEQKGDVLQDALDLVDVP